MPVVARADCTEAIGHANYTLYQDQETGLLQIEYKEDSFEIQFRACEGWQYKDDITPQQYQEAKDIHRLGLRRQTNDLSALVFRQYLEGKTNTEFTDEYEKTVVGYKYPEVNSNDNEREKVCKAAFEEKFPGKPWEKYVEYTTQYVQRGCTKYNSGNRFDFRPPNTPLQPGNAETCSDACREAGYPFFVFECPMSNGEVHCQCYSDERVSDKDVENKNCNEFVGGGGKKHCTGSGMIDGLSMGGADIGSIYEVPTTQELDV